MLPFSPRGSSLQESPRPSIDRDDHRPALLRWDICCHPEANELLVPLTYAAENPLSDAGSNDDLTDELLGALEALGGSAGNGRLREILEWEEASYEAVKADLLNRQLIVSGRGRGGSVALADDSGVDRSGNGQATSRAPRTRAPNGSRAASAPSSFEQAFRAIDDCLDEHQRVTFDDNRFAEACGYGAHPRSSSVAYTTRPSYIAINCHRSSASPRRVSRLRLHDVHLAKVPNNKIRT